MNKPHILSAWLAVMIVLAMLGTLCVTAFATDSRVVGDLDRSGRPDSADVRMLLLHIIGERSLDAARMKQADCNGDGRVNTIDARMIIDWATTGVTQTMPTTTTTTVTTTTTRLSLDDEGYYDDVVKP